MQHDAAGVALGDFLGHHRRNIAYSPSGLLSTAAGNRQTAVNQLVWVVLSTMIFDQIIIGEVKADIAPGDRMRFISISCFTGLYTLSPAPPAFAAR